LPSLYRIGFVIEQALGHITHGKNIQESLRYDPSVIPSWILPGWSVSGFAAKIPVYRSNWTVRAGFKTRQGLALANRREKLDALFFHTQITAVLAQDWLRRIPSIVSLDATPLQYDRLGEYYDHAQGNEWLEHWKWGLNRDCFKAARKIVTWSEWAKHGLVDEYEVLADKVTVLSPGVNTRFWAKADGRWRTNPVKILFVGGDLERKGGNLLLEAYRLIREEQIDGNMRGVGHHAIELHMVTNETLPPEPGIFVYNGILPNSPELRSLYHDCDIFCLPTNGDCLPMVLSEASAASLPVISTSLAAIPEIIKEGKNGFLISPGDCAALKARLSRLIEDPRLRIQMGAEGAKIAFKNHDSPTNTAQLVGLLKELADENQYAKKKGR
jgi:glycosyltransferase involved in cell wall biosynthesis